MGRRLRRLRHSAMLAVVLAVAPPAAGADDLSGMFPIPLSGTIRIVDGVITMIAQPIEPIQPIQPIQPVQPLQPVQPVPGAIDAGAFGGLIDLELLSTSAEAVTGAEATVLAATDAGGLLQQSNSVQTVHVQRRSPVAMDPHLRGFHVGQIYSQGDGIWWFPVRTDLDTMLSHIDPTSIQNMVVIPGPYGLRYGPGLSFIDVVTASTPRYCNGYESHHRAGVTYHANGAQIYGRETFSGGSSDWGFIFSYGNRNGSDYEAGNRQRIPSTYKNQNFLGQVGIDISPDSSLEFRYQRLDVSVAGFRSQKQLG